MSTEAKPDIGDPVRYPLYCVDRHEVMDEGQFSGPFDSHDAAQDQHCPNDLVARCRRLRPSEIGFAAEDVLDCPTISDVADIVDEYVTHHGEIPEGAWYSHSAKRVVHVEIEDGTLPTRDNAKAWCDEHLSVDVYICEGDET